MIAGYHFQVSLVRLEEIPSLSCQVLVSYQTELIPFYLPVCVYQQASIPRIICRFHRCLESIYFSLNSFCLNYLLFNLNNRFLILCIIFRNSHVYTAVVFAWDAVAVKRYLISLVLFRTGCVIILHLILLLIYT